MKKQLIAAGIIGASLLAITAQQSDPVLMTVNGKPVPVSEFEYLYNKNNAQQVEPQTIDQYVDMFVNYKLKVADAEANGIDTTEAFVSEYTKFRNELAQPYLRDQAVLDSLIALQYEHAKWELLVSHIMLPDGQNKLLDSIRTAILDGKISFEDAAREYADMSGDKVSARRGGLMGVVMPGRYPWAFEEAAYKLNPGEISPVINSGYGLHIIRVDKKSPARGEVNASHILRMTRNLSDSAAAAQKLRIDSIYAVVKANPDQFADVAKRLSEDPGSATRGGELGWFGGGMMVQEFDSVAFALPVGEISEPFRTAFGWHIIKKNDARGIGSLEDNREKMITIFQGTERGTLPERKFLQNAIDTYNAKLLSENIGLVPSLFEKSGSSELDSAFIASISTSDLPVFVVDGKSTTLGQISKYVSPARLKTADAIQRQIANVAREQMNVQVLDLVRENLGAEHPEYRNLVNEYRDGILLFEISNRNVWDKASKDKEGLEKYFRANRNKYKWETPKFKSYVIFTSSDSLLNEAMKYADSLPADLDKEGLVEAMKTKFGRDVKVEKVIAGPGDNKITDFLAFGGEKPEAENARWSCYAAFRGEIIPQPEEAADVRGAAVSDYQNALEQEWLKKLHKKYKVKINKKVLEQIK